MTGIIMAPNKINFNIGKKLKRKGGAGFTIIELMVVIAVFLFIIGAAIGIFLSIIKNQKRILSETQFLSQISYVEEYMSKALRMAKTATLEQSDTDCLGREGYIYLLTKRNPTTGFYQGIKFINPSDNNACQEFFLDNDGVLKEQKNGGSLVALTPTSLQFYSASPIRFAINGGNGSSEGCLIPTQCGASDGDSVQPRVTILMNVFIEGDSGEKTCANDTQCSYGQACMLSKCKPIRSIQTTVSRRNLKASVIQLPVPPEELFPVGWGYRKKITIPNTNITQDLTNFPLLVSLDDPDIGANVWDKANGYDIRFTDSGGTTLLAYEREDFSVVEGRAKGNFWVKVPSLSSTFATDIYIYYSKAEPLDRSYSQSVWDNNYKGVWHFNNPSDPYDSTLNANHGINVGTTPVSGKVGTAADFDGLSSIGVPDSYSLRINGPFTLSGWIKFSVPNSGTNWFFGKWRDTGDKRSYAMWFWYNGSWDRLTSGVSDDGTWKNEYKLEGGAALSANNWHYVTGVYDGTNITIYRDGLPDGSKPGPASISVNDSPFVIGAHEASNYFKGIIDEVRISDTARSSAWIKAENYLSGAHNNIFFSAQEPNPNQ